MNSPNDLSKEAEQRSGILYTISAFVIYGILPVYWRALNDFSAGLILSHRIFWSCIIVLLIITFNKQLTVLKEVFGDRKRLRAVATSSILITSNWFLYIWAVNNNHIVEAALGYYINPLISVMLGMIFLKEKLDRGTIIALLLAASGVLFKTIQFGQFPWIAIVLALTFGFYGLSKKTAGVDSTVGLALETLMVVPLALGHIIYTQGISGQFFTLLPHTLLLFIFSGVVTALPLILFGKGAQRIPLSTLGFIQYLFPSITLSIGVFFYGEPFTKVDLVSFGLIWCAVGVFTYSQIAGNRPVKTAKTM